MGLDDLRSWLTEGSAPATGQRAIDPSRPRLSNPDGSFSTEETIGIEADGKHYNIPTIVGGKRLTDQQAIDSWRKEFSAGNNTAAGTFNTRAEADAAGPARSAAIGNVARESDLKAKGAVMFTPAEQRANAASETSPRALAEAQRAIDTAKTPAARAALQESLDQTLTMGGEAPRRAIGLGKRGGHFQGLSDWLKEGSPAGTEPASAPAAPVEEPGIVRKAVDSVLNVLRPVDRTKQDKRIADVADRPWEQARQAAAGHRDVAAEPGNRQAVSQMRTENIDAETAGKPLPHTQEAIRTLERQQVTGDAVQRGAVERGVETERKAAREVAMGDFGRNMIATAQKIDPGLGEMGPLWRGMVGGFIQAYGESWLRDLDAGYSTDHPIFGKPDEARKTFQQLAGLGEAWVDEADRRNKQITGDLKPGLGAKVADSAVTSLAMMAPALAAGALTKNPMTVIGIMSGETGAQAYGEARHEGLSPGQAGTYALLQATIEGGTEYLPMKALFRSSRDEVKWLLRFLAREVPGEMLATTLQDAVDKVSVRPEMTVKDFGEDLITTILSTPLAAGAQAAAVRGVRGPAKGMTEDDRDEILAKFKDGMAELESVKAETAKTAKARAAPTHKLDDGTPVRQRSEGGQPVAGVWETQDGAIVEAPRADPITVPDANAEMRVGGVPYEVTVVGKGREKDTARLADGQEVPLTQIESMGDEAKDVLGLLPPEEKTGAKKQASAATKKAVSKPTAKAPAAAAPGEAPAAAAVPEQAPQAPEQATLIEPPAPPKPIFTGKAPELEGTRSLQRQNRLRGNVASVAQMNAIAENPDYDRVSASKAPETGAPMVSISGDTEAIPVEQQGRVSVVTIGGTKVPIRYAVVESDSLLASHKADGTERPEYFADAEPGQIRALNNGRAAGLRDAYARGTAQSYREALAADPDHGIAPEAIAKLQRPILVRVYSDAFNTSIANIGEKSQGETLKQSPLEIALQDAAKLEDADFEVFDPGESGDVASAGNQKFIDLFLNKIVSAEDRGALVDQATQRPNKAAYDRIEAAVFQRAYGSQALTGMFAEAEDPEIRTVLRALSIAAPEMVKLSGVEVQLDIRPYVADAAGLFLKAKREKTTIDKLVKQGDFTLNPLVVEFANVMAEFKNAPRKLGEGLKAGAKWAQWAAAQANTADIFGDSPKYGIGDALKNIDTFMELEYGKGQAAAQDRAPYETGEGAPAGTASSRAKARGDDAVGGKQAAVDAKGKREGAGDGTVRRKAGVEVEQQRGPYATRPTYEADTIHAESQARALSAEESARLLTSGELTQIPEREGWCYYFAGKAAQHGEGSLVIGAMSDGHGRFIWHAVIKRADGAIYDPTVGRVWAPGVWDSLQQMRIAKEMTAKEVIAFGQLTKKWPDPNTLGLKYGSHNYLTREQHEDIGTPVLELKGDTPAELKAKADAAAAKPEKEPKAPTPAVKRPEQVDFFDPQQQSLFQGRAGYDEAAAVDAAAADAKGHLASAFSAKEVPGTPALAFEKTVVGTQTIGSVSVPAGQVNGAEQAAQAFQQLRKYPSERFQVLGLNANNEPVALFDVGRGSLASVNVPFREVFTAVYQTPGIKSVWLAHQHPSGASWPSSSDQAMTENMNRGFSGHGGISIAGHVILAGNRAAELNAQGDHVRSFEVPTAIPETQSVPIVERVIESEDLQRGDGLLSADAVREYLKTLAPKESGVLILDFQNRPIGWWPMSVAEMAKLKTGDVSTGVARLFRMVGRNNPGGAIAFSPNVMGDEAQGVFGKAVANLGAALRLVEVKMLDAFHPHKNDPGNLQSLAQKGIPTVASQFYRLAEPTVDAVTAEDARGELSSHPIYQALGDKVEVVESPYELPDEVFEQLVDDGAVHLAKAIFHAGTGKIYLIASNLSRGEAEVFMLHESVGHMGIFNVLPHQTGRDLRESFLDIYRSRSGEIRNEARSGFLKPYKLDFRNTNHQAIAAAEWIAHHAETGEQPSLWKRIVGAVRSALRKAGFVKEWSDADIQHLLKLSRLSLTNASGNSVNGMPPILAALRAGETAMPSVTKAFTADGKPLLQTATVTLGDPDNLLGWIKPGVMALDYTVFDPNGDAVGNVTLDWNRENNTFDGLRFIGTNPSGQGHGDNILRSVLAYNPPQHPLRIHQILPGARAWWENRGVVVDGKGATPNGTLTRAGYVGSRTDRADTGEGRAAQAGDDAARAGQEGAFGTQGQLYALREPNSITEVYGVKDGRLLGLAARATGNVWNVYLANGTNETLFAAGQFRRMQAGSLNEVNRIFNTAGLELNVVKPRNIPVPDRSIFDQDWVAPQADNWFKRSVIYLQNRLLLPRQYEETIAKFVGPIPDSAKVHREARIAHPRAAGKIADFDHEHTEPLIAVMRRRRLSLRDVGQYLYALHAPERNAAIELKNPGNKAGSGITDARAAQILADLQTRGLLPVLEREVKPIIDGIRRAREQVLIDSGRAKREAVEVLRNTYPNYVPLKDIVDDEYAQEQVTPGFGVSSPFRTAFGRWTEAQSEFILPGLIAQAKGTIAAGENAEVLRSLLRLVSFAPNPSVWLIQKYVAKPYIDRDTGQFQFYQKPVLTDHDLAARAISVPVDGDLHVIVVKDADLARAFKSSGLPVPEAARLFGVITRFYAVMATAANPEFVMVNLMRDFQQAMVRLTGEENPKLALKVAKDMLPALWGAYSGLRAKGQLPPDAGEWHRWYRRFIEAGGHVAYRGMVDTETQHKDFLTSLAEAGILPEEVGGFDKLRLKAHRAARVIGAKAMTKLVLDANGAVENALRLSAFKNGIESGMNEKDAAFLARNVTVDFNLKGEASSRVGALYMFFNANIQGNALLFRSIINHRAMKYAVAALFFMGMGSDWWNRRWARKTEDGRNHYDNIADSVKEKNIIIMGPDRQNAITIPLSFGFNVFYVAGANAMAVMQGAKKPAEAAKSTFVTMMNAFNPFGQSPSSLLGALQMISPTPFDPSVQAMTNRNWMDKPIRPERPRFATPQSDAATYFSKTPEHWIDMARFLNEQTGGNDVRGGIIDVSPNMLQHWGHSIFGSAGGFYSRVAEAVITKAKGEKLETRDIPFLRRFYYEPKDFELSQRFYQNLNNAEVAHYEVRRAMESGNPERASVLRGEFQRERQMFGEAQMAERRVSELRKQAADIRKNDRLTRDQKRERTEKLDEQTSTTMMMFNRRYDERTER